LAVVTAVGVSRVTVLWGFVGAVGALVLFTVGMSALAVFNGWVPDLFHPWLVIALTYTGVTAYRLLYEDREKRKVTALFGQYLTPEIVAQLAKTKGGVEDILRGGERRDITLMFVDIRGFTSMSESMAARDVTELVQLYLDQLTETIFVEEAIRRHTGVGEGDHEPRMEEVGHPAVEDSESRHDECVANQGDDGAHKY